MSFYEMKFRAWETSARCRLFQGVLYGHYDKFEAMQSFACRAAEGERAILEEDDVRDWYWPLSIGPKIRWPILIFGAAHFQS